MSHHGRSLRSMIRSSRTLKTPPTPKSSLKVEVTDILAGRPAHKSSSVIPNTGSTARDHLANERTFLAWARTGLAFVGLGVAIDSIVRVSTANDTPSDSDPF